MAPQWQVRRYGVLVEVALTGEHALVRDAKHPDDGQLAFDAEAWTGFVIDIKNGRFG